MPKVQRQQTIQPAGKKAFKPKSRPIWEVVTELGLQISDQEWQKVPSDAARNYKHYLYGAPKDGN